VSPGWGRQRPATIFPAWLSAAPAAPAAQIVTHTDGTQCSASPLMALAVEGYDRNAPGSLFFGAMAVVSS